eukprot:maker-scaffold199_size265817-snap-gene-1.51 protein:Tk08939 transcript:maker-scaffold199_size265817-snap-gene-1.51-mRNA-1 annotation:"secreted effector protein"
MKLRAPNRSSTSPFLVGLIFWFVLIHSTHFASGRFHAKNKFWRCLVKVTRSMIDCSHQRHICCFVIRNNRRQYARKIRTTVPQDFIEILKTIPDVQNAQPAPQFGPIATSYPKFHSVIPFNPKFHSVVPSFSKFGPIVPFNPKFHSVVPFYSRFGLIVPTTYLTSNFNRADHSSGSS